jgi:osmotically inducible lipoprotein OsmB
MIMARILASVSCALVLASTLAGCGTPTRQQVGIGAGAAIGGVAGSMATGGSGFGTAGGAALGGIIGNQVAK